jgi:hypothetical protein
VVNTQFTYARIKDAHNTAQEIAAKTLEEGGNMLILSEYDEWIKRNKAALYSRVRAGDAVTRHGYGCYRSSQAQYTKRGLEG